MKYDNDIFTEHKMPRFAFRFLQFTCPENLYEEIEGDLLQKFEQDIKRFGGSEPSEDCCGM